jgi:hypothetical protein
VDQFISVWLAVQAAFSQSKSKINKSKSAIKTESKQRLISNVADACLALVDI